MSGLEVRKGRERKWQAAGVFAFRRKSQLERGVKICVDSCWEVEFILFMEQKLSAAFTRVGEISEGTDPFPDQPAPVVGNSFRGVAFPK